MGVQFIETDGGRKEAGFEKEDVSDCVCRAVAIASGRPYNEIYRRLSEGNYKQRKSKHVKDNWGGKNLHNNADYGVFTNRKWFKDYMKELGFEWFPTMSIGSGCKVHVKASELPKGRLVLKLSRHSAAFIDGVLHDTYDCSRGGKRCVYGYYKLKQEN